ncbi:MAG: acyltransferase [Acidimicrobiales bacterium]|nr:acyltransferase [Acidimicrobiales bacterium]
MAYVPALDGIRAIAVVAVLLYHGGVSFVSGGFLGVDVFFVLSGYLITELFLLEHERNCRIDLKAFWLRRARRLLPAVGLVIAFIAVYAFTVADPGELGRIRGDGVATLLYVANWWYAFSGQSYFEQFQSPSPFRHTWSLAIEEQFYLVWPLLVAGGLALWGKDKRRWVAALLFGAGLSAVLMAALFHPDRDPSRVFYGTDTRAQALLVGAALAWMLHRIDFRRVGEPQLEALGGIGLVVVAAMFWLAHDGTRSPWLYRGGFLAVAAAAAAVVAAAVSPYRGPLTKLLGSAPLVAIGRISYGLYLWHWPIYVWLSPPRVELEGVALLAVRLAASFAAAIGSYLLIEQPIRTGALRRPPLRLATGVAAACVLILFLVSTRNAGPNQLEVAERQFRAAQAGSSSTPGQPSQGGAAGTGAGAQAGTGQSGEASANAGADEQLRVLVFGDSMAFSLAMGGYLSGATYQAGVVLDFRTELGCSLFAGSARDAAGQPVPSRPDCGNWEASWRDGMSKFDADVNLLYTGAWDVWDRTVNGQDLVVGTPKWQAYAQQEIDRAVSVLATNGKPVVILGLPCYEGPTDLGGPPVKDSPLDRAGWLNEIYRRTADRHPDKVSIIDLGVFLCDNGDFRDEIDGHRITKDGVHFEPEGTIPIWAWLAPQLRAVAGRN